MKARRWCPECRRNVLAQTNPMTCGEYCAHGAITLFTCGLWFPVALVWAIARKYRYLCPNCGHGT